MTIYECVNDAEIISQSLLFELVEHYMNVCIGAVVLTVCVLILLTVIDERKDYRKARKLLNTNDLESKLATAYINAVFKPRDSEIVISEAIADKIKSAEVK